METTAADTATLAKRAFVGILTAVGLVAMLVLVVRPQGGSLPGAGGLDKTAVAQQLPGTDPLHTGAPAGLPSDGTEAAPDLSELLPSLDLPTILPEHFPDETTAPAHADVIVATANLYTRLPWAEARQDLQRVASGAHLIGLNEVTPGRAAQISGWTTGSPDWTFVRPTDPRSEWSGSNAVLVDSSVFEVLEQGVVYGSPASMPAYRIDSRWITWVQLRERSTGRGLVYLQTHMDAAVERGGVPRRGAAARVRNNEQYMRTLDTLARTFQSNHEVLVGGDWNVDASADRRAQHPRMPFTALEKRNAEGPGLRSTYSLLGLGVPPTSKYAGGRWIDYLAVWQRAEGGATVLSHQVLTGVHSDHNPLVATVRIPAP